MKIRIRVWNCQITDRMTHARTMEYVEKIKVGLSHLIGPYDIVIPSNKCGIDVLEIDTDECSLISFGIGVGRMTKTRAEEHMKKCMEIYKLPDVGIKRFLYPICDTCAVEVIPVPKAGVYE